VQRCVEPESPRVATKPSAITDQLAALEPTLLRTRTYGKEMAMLLAAQLVNS
jgi:hypothetical protein